MLPEVKCFQTDVERHENRPWLISAHVRSKAQQVRQMPNFVPCCARIVVEGTKTVPMIIEDLGYYILNTGSADYTAFKDDNKISNIQVWTHKQGSAAEFFLRALSTGQNPKNKIIGLYECTQQALQDQHDTLPQNKYFALLQGETCHTAFRASIKDIWRATSEILLEEALLASTSRNDVPSVRFFLACEPHLLIFQRAFELAAKHGFIEIIKAIAEKAIKSDQVLDLDIPTQQAAANGQEAALTALLDLADSFPENCLKTALVLAAVRDKVSTVSILLSEKYICFTNPTKALLASAARSSARVLKLLLDTGTIDRRVIADALAQAASGGNTSAVDLFIRCKNFQENDGIEALKNATIAGHFDILLKLLVRGVPTDETELLKLSARKGHIKLVEYFFLCFRLYRTDTPNYKQIAYDAALSTLGNQAMIEFILSQMMCDTTL